MAVSVTLPRRVLIRGELIRGGPTGPGDRPGDGRPGERTAEHQRQDAADQHPPKHRADECPEDHPRDGRDCARPGAVVTGTGAADGGPSKAASTVFGPRAFVPVAMVAPVPLRYRPRVRRANSPLLSAH